jgi:hypothetical protein|tara:strand:- start:25 stop:252 length:228 start_codon:yes stop_codon:yes gene_type:complete
MPEVQTAPTIKYPEQENWPSAGQAIELRHQLHQLILRTAINRTIDPMRMHNRELSPGMLAGMVAAYIEETLTAEL